MGNSVFHMKPRSILQLIAFCTISPLWSQCNIAAGNAYSGPSCVGSQPSGFVSLQWTGGTAPFTLTLPLGGSIQTNQHTALVHFPVPLVGNGPFSFTGFGWGYTITDALGCQASGNYTMSIPFPWIYDDAVNSFITQTTIVDANAGVFNLALLDNPADGGTPFLYPTANGYTYSLTRNGSVVASGTFVSVLQQSPTRLVFSSLTGGNYVCNYTLGVSDPAYCPPAGSISFFLPNAGDVNTNLYLRAALQGPLPSGTVMSDALRSANLIPLTEPYSALGYTYVGSAPGGTMPAAMLAVTGNDAIEDWVVVELRSATTPSQVLYSKAALIQRDGDVVDTDGDAYVSFPLAAGNYYVALRHRNHLGVMTSAARTLGITPITVDFRSAATGCYGTTPRVQVGSVYCLWSGDGNGNGTLHYVGANNDRDPILTAVGGTTPNNTLINVYDRRDVNMDGVIRYVGANNDRDPILTNVGSTTPNNTRVQQLP
jgi:hypothetical protein